MKKYRVTFGVPAGTVIMGTDVEGDVTVSMRAENNAELQAKANAWLDRLNQKASGGILSVQSFVEVTE